MTYRQARRKLGTRSHRRANTNGKVLYGTKYGGGGKNRKLPMRRNPRPVRSLAHRVRQLVRGVV
jgi:hypothetical protein